MVRRGGIGPAVLLATVAFLSPAPAGAQHTPGPPDGSRIVAARIFQDGQYTAEHQTPATIGAALASLRPTYVSSLIRLSDERRVTAREAAAWRTVVAAVRATSPEAKFAVELNTVEYSSAAELRRMMDRVRTALDNDGWLLDFYSLAARQRPRMVRSALAYAHANGEFVGGNVFGIAERLRIPATTDYVAVQDFAFHLNLPAVRRLAARVPVYYHMMNSPDRPRSVGCVFMEQFSTKRRMRYIAKRAAQQGAYRFRVAYPVFFPECERRRGTPNASLFSYDAPRDPPMMARIASLMDRYALAGAPRP